MSGKVQEPGSLALLITCASTEAIPRQMLAGSRQRLQLLKPFQGCTPGGACCTGVRQEEGCLRVLGAAEMARRNGLFGRKGSEAASLKPSEQAIHSIRCSPPVRDTQVSFCAYYAGSSGLKQQV